MRATRNLLAGLTDVYPPGDGQSHAIRLGADGNLEITLFLGKHYQTMIVGDDDLDKSIEQSLVEIDTALPTWCKETDSDSRRPPVGEVSL